MWCDWVFVVWCVFVLFDCECFCFLVDGVCVVLFLCFVGGWWVWVFGVCEYVFCFGFVDWDGCCVGWCWILIVVFVFGVC